MKLIKGLFLLVMILLATACSEELTREQEADLLKEQLARIEAMASTESCQLGQSFGITPFGHKGCGGPVGFMAYSLDIDVVEFLAAVESYSEAQRAFNLKWGVISDCSLPAAPSSAICQDGQVTLVY